MRCKKNFWVTFVLVLMGVLLCVVKGMKTTVSVENNIEMKDIKKIALTFDDGPSAYTEELLDGLKIRNVKATFFVIGKNAEKYQEIVVREVQEGHLVGNHTYSHVKLTQLDNHEAQIEVEKTSKILEELTQKEVEYIRPPFGCWDDNYQKLGLLPVMWTVDPLDWMTKNTEEIVKKVVTKVKENDIILLHDCYQSSVDAALQIVDQLQAKGFEFVTVEELLLE